MTSKMLITASNNVSSLYSSVKTNVAASIKKFRFNEKWKDRNKQYGDIFLKLFEVDSVRLNQFIFVEATPETLEKINFLEFSVVNDFKHEQLMKKFSCTVYNETYNVALTLYNTDAKYAVLTAHAIVTNSLLEVMAPNPVTSLMVFHTAVTQLMEDT